MHVVCCVFPSRNSLLASRMRARAIDVNYPPSQHNMCARALSAPSLSIQRNRHRRMRARAPQIRAAKIRRGATRAGDASGLAVRSSKVRNLCNCCIACRRGYAGRVRGVDGGCMRDRHLLLTLRHPGTTHRTLCSPCATAAAAAGDDDV